MSRLRLPNGDDHPEAAGKFLNDARALLGANRHDGTAYLAGYVAECSLKALLLHEKGFPLPGASLPWKGRNGHNLAKLHSDAATLASAAGARTARYFGASMQGLLALALAAWDPEVRYRAPSATRAQATAWLTDAESIYRETVAEMIKDGVV
jgi:hypothetical protein